MKQLVAIALLYVAFVGLPDGVTIPIPSPTPSPSPSPTPLPLPSPKMQAQVASVAAILKNAEYFDRAIFVEVWNRSASVISNEDPSVEISFDNTLGLRLYTTAVANVAWKRLANASGKYPGLNDAIEAAFAQTLGTDVRPITPELIAEYAELCRALAWAGMPTNQ